MSFYFYIHTPKLLTHEAILEGVDNQDVFISNITEEDEGDTTLKPDYHYNYFIMNRATRGTTLVFTNNMYQVYLNALACKDDYYLALDILQSIAEQTGSEIETEAGEKFTTAALLREKYNNDWVDGHIRMAVESTEAIIKDKGKVTAFGCIRNFVIGPNTLELIRSMGDDLSESMMEAFRRSQFIDPEKYIDANVYIVDEGKAEEWTYSVIPVDTGVILPETDFVFLFFSENEHYRIPRKDFFSLESGKVQMIDEEQVQIEPMSEPDMRHLLAQLSKPGTSNPN
jgi:hypothetical protein